MNGMPRLECPAIDGRRRGVGQHRRDRVAGVWPARLRAEVLRWVLRVGVLVAVAAGAAASPSGGTTADHAKFEALQGPFVSGEAVTKACLGCHTEAARQVMATRHWTWEYTHPKTGQKLGKKTMLNSFCIGDRSNEPFCQSCHVGYGWKDAGFDFKASTKVDCLVCHHDGGYSKPPGMAGEVPTVRTELPPGSGNFVGPVDLAKVAQGVGKSGVANCGSCHFYGGGGDGVKHGDLDSSLVTSERALDVHMAPKDKGGAGFSCATCHQADGHRIAGSRVQMTAADPHGPALRGADDGRSAATCQSCHGDKPHKESLLAVQRLNNHTDVLACQACHVPAFARGGVPTKMAWDWSTAGKLSPEGKPFQTKDAHGHVVYDSKKGDFTLGENVVPDYVWFDGTVSYTLQDDKIDPTDLVRINRFHGTPGDKGSRIWPVKRFNGQQPYDKVNLKLLVPHTAVPDDTAFWFNFDWPKALRAGAEATGKPFSGEYGFVRTEMLWPITHMVAPKTQAVRCSECHADGGRLAGVEGVYVPGRDAQPWIDRLGWLAVAGALGGVLLHAGVRVVTGRRAKGGHHG
jgi:octaheme c-type cytochrome (tetrathionate reductase family)